MHAEVFCGLPDDAARLRREIFMDEQGFENEFDDVDERAAHIVLYEGREPLATCRYYRADDGRYFIGRVAVSRSCRGMALGAALMREAETRIAAHGGEEAFVCAAFTKSRAMPRSDRSMPTKAARISLCAKY